MNRLVGIVIAILCSAAHADPIRILFVGDSYTFGRVEPVMSYNAANVHDLTAGFHAIDPEGANPWEPHPWGGVPGIFKKLTDEVGLDYDVSISARNATSLRGHFLDTAGSDWKLRENVASRRWDIVVLQEQSDAALPAGKGRNARRVLFDAYADRFERFIHDGSAQSFRETESFGSLAACTATGLSAGSCNTTRSIAGNSNANADAKVYLTETWARPDMVYAHKVTKADRASPTGSPVVETGARSATLYYPTLAAMTADLQAAFHAKLASNPKFAGVIPVGDAFQYAFDHGPVKTDGFYDANGAFTPPRAGEPMNLWWNDYLHASKYGSYLDALVQFGVVTGLNPAMLGADDAAARDLGIGTADALTLQRVAATQVGAVPRPKTVALAALPVRARDNDTHPAFAGTTARASGGAADYRRPGAGRARFAFPWSRWSVSGTFTSVPCL